MIATLGTQKAEAAAAFALSVVAAVKGAIF